jgi:hypothetical protein
LLGGKSVKSYIMVVAGLAHVAAIEPQITVITFILW